MYDMLNFDSNNQWLQAPSSLPNVNNELHIWLADLNELSQNEQMFYEFLSIDEQIRASDYKFARDRTNFICARGVLRSIISKYLKVRPRDLNFSYNVFGKPYLHDIHNTEKISFNLSHADGLAIYIISKSLEVGIDLERIKPINNLAELIINTFSKKEVENFYTIPEHDRLAAFYRCWTRKEAYIKALGTGLSYPLNQFSVSLCQNQPTKILHVGAGDIPSNCTILSIDCIDNYQAAFAFIGVVEQIFLWQYGSSHHS